MACSSAGVVPSWAQSHAGLPCCRANVDEEDGAVLWAFLRFGDDPWVVVGGLCAVVRVFRRFGDVPWVVVGGLCAVVRIFLRFCGGSWFGAMTAIGVTHSVGVRIRPHNALSSVGFLSLQKLEMWVVTIAGV